MSVIIRLQNLPWSANALDIRQHFQGLSIPEGGVHIVGGEQGDAFIAFSTDEDARQAMMTDGGKIKEVKLKLMLSSRTEMQKVIEQARQQSVSLQNLLQMPAPPILPTPTPPPAPAPVAVVVVPPPDPPKLPERRDSDTLSNSSKDKERRGSDRKERSRSRDRDRNRRDKDRRRRSRSRDRSRRRKSRDRSRERSKERDRKRPAGRDPGDARRTSRDRTDARRDFRRDTSKDDNKNNDQNGSVLVKPPLLVNPVSATSVWAIPPGQVDAKPMGFSKSLAIPNRSAPVTVPAEVNVGRGDMDGRRIMGSGPFPTGTMRPLSGTDVEPVGPFQGSRESWQGQSRPPGEMGGRFPPADRPGGFMGSEPARTQGFGNEGSDFDGRGDFLPRGGSFRGGPFRGNPDIRRSFPPGRLGTGPGNILGPPGTMHRASFPRGPLPGEQFPRGDRFEPYPNRFVSDRFSRASESRNYDPRVQNPGCCVEVRNIALDSGYSDIRKFFTGIYVANNAIKIINDNKGHRVGIAYMRFANIEAKDRAIKLTGKQIRGSIVEIMHLEDEIFDKAIDSFKPDMVIDISDTVEPRVDNSCLHIQDLPAYVKESDIYKLFPKFAIAEVVFSADEERKQNMAFVKFVRAEDAKNALFSNSKHMIGNTPVKVMTCGLDQLQQAKSRVSTKDSKDLSLNGSAVKDPRSRSDIEPVAKIPIGVVSDCILLKGLPYQTNDRDLLDFFSDVALVPLRIHIMLDNFNKPSGDAYCEFSSYEETMQACTKNNTMLGKQEVTVKPVLRAEMLEALGLPMQPELGPPKHMLGGPRPPFNRNFGRPMGILGNGPRMPMMGRPMGPNLMMGPGGPMGPPPKDAPIEGFGKPGCVVALENIPFRAEVDEILEIFSDFDVTRESVIRRFNDLGMPTGDARVSFPSPPEAQRAARELRGVQIRGRPIFLNLL